MWWPLLLIICLSTAYHPNRALAVSLVRFGNWLAHGAGGAAIAPIIERADVVPSRDFRAFGTGLNGGAGLNRQIAFVIGKDVREPKHLVESYSVAIDAGGGVDAKESLETAAVRELKEEVGLTPASPPQFLGIFFSHRFGKSDHVGLFQVDVAGEAVIDAFEIKEARFFPLDALPEGASPVTKKQAVVLRNCRAGITTPPVAEYARSPK